MSKALFGFAAALALVTSSARAGDEKSGGNAGGDSVASTQIDGRSTSDGEKVTARVIEARSDIGGMEESSDVSASHEVSGSHEDRWLVEREGYRDGGY